MNLFDVLEANAYTVVSNTMGYDAVWVPLDGISETQTARVLLNRPTQKQNITDEEYDAMSPKMEYFSGQLPGLFESVRDNNSETITINGVAFITLRAELKFDGKTIIVHLDFAT